jgi:thermitase
MQSGNPPRRRASAIALAALALACAVAMAPASSFARSDARPDAAPASRLAEVPHNDDTFVSGEAIVQFSSSAPATKRRRAREAADVDFEQTLGLPHAQVVSVDGSVNAAVRNLERQPGVAYAQPNYLYEATAPAPAPDDTFFPLLWGLDDPAPPNAGVGALDAWEAGKKGSGRVIAILDTGVDLTHPDLLANLWEGEAGVHGHDFVDGDSDPDDYNFHGTHVAGTAAATAYNTQGIAGVAPAAEIMAVRVLDGDGVGDTADIAAGVEYAATNGADVINMSLGGLSSTGDKAMEDAIATAGEAEAVVVVAAGNDSADNDAEPHTPCALKNPNLICVAALDGASGALASFSNYGKGSVDIAAPGASIISAKTDYGAPVFSDGFESEFFPGPWNIQTAFGGKPWGTDTSAASGLLSATDSPGGTYGQALDEEHLATSFLFTDAPIDLEGQRGCRVHFRTKYDVERDFDEFTAGAFSEGPFEPGEHFDELSLDGKSSKFPAFIREEASISDLDDRPDVHPVFGLISDFEVEKEGAYVDDVRVICRDETYENEVVHVPSEYDLPTAGNYVPFQGTSMATPHVAGVVALVRAAEPELDVGEVIDAVLNGASAIPEITSGKRTATEGIADACKAVAIASGADVEAECPASSEPVQQPDVKIGDGESNSDELQEPISAPVAPAATPAPGARPDVRAPQTFFRHKPPRVVRTRGRARRVAFRFGSNERGVIFLCQFDRKRYRICPQRFARRFRVGRHVLRVKARDAAGNVDRTPTLRRFRVKRIGQIR